MSRILIPLCLLLLTFLKIPLYSQVVVSEKTFQFGEVIHWQSPPAVFSVKNESLKGQYIMQPLHSKSVAVDFPRTRLEPGESAEIHVYFYTKKTGAFQEDIVFTVSNTKEPLKISIKGNIKSHSIHSLSQPPQQNAQKRYDRPAGLIQGRVEDALTGKPLANARIDFQGATAVYSNAEGLFSLSLPIGRYQIMARAQDYQVSSRNEVFNIKNNALVIPLTKGVSPGVAQELADENPEFSIKTFKANNLVIVADVSSSMKKEMRFDHMISALSVLLNQVRSIDFISLLSFSSVVTEAFVLQPGNNKTIMLNALKNLKPEGRTATLAGLESAYMLAGSNFMEHGVNAVLFITDGVFTVNKSMLDMIQGYKEKGIQLFVMGFGADKAGQNNLQKMAEAGNGEFIRFISSESNESLLLDVVKKNAFIKP